MTTQISFVEVSKKYEGSNGTVAVDNLSFEINKGEFVGYAGPNGAGKSTSIKAMIGVLSVTSGMVRVRGVDPLHKRRQLARHAGVVFGQRSQMLWELSASAFFDMIKALYRMRTADFRSRLAHLTEIMELGAFIDQPVRSLSLGQRMRCELASALLPNPEILFLDEPTIGLDVEARAAMRETLRERNDQEGTTIVLTTHDLSDIEALCSRLIIIDHGKMAYDGSIEQLFDQHSPEATVEFHITGSADLDLPSSWKVDARPGTVRVTFDRRQTRAAEVIQSVLSQIDVVDLRIVEPTIEDIIRGIYSASRS